MGAFARLKKILNRLKFLFYRRRGIPPMNDAEK